MNPLALGQRILAPFATRSFRYQWPADSCISWALEMETLILGWYVLVESGSVLMLTAFGSLQYIGTLAAPMLGTLGDRLGLRRVLSAMRFGYAGAAGLILALAATDQLSPMAVLVVAGLAGLVRPSDIGLRTALVSATVPAPHLMSAMGIARSSMDSAKVAGALAGTAVVAVYGMVPAYVVITAMHLAGAWLTLRTDAGRLQAPPETVRPSHWLAMREGLAVVWRTPQLLAAMSLAALVNFSAFPFSGGLMPYVAREVYGLDQRGLGWLIASYGIGALTGSIAMGALGARFAPGRLMLAAGAVWYLLLIGFAFSPTPMVASIWLAAAGVTQSISMLALQLLLMQTTPPHLRGRIMGVRMLAIYPLPLGLLLAGALIPPLGFRGTAALMLCGGIALVLAIGLAWGKALRPEPAPVPGRTPG